MKYSITVSLLVLLANSGTLLSQGYLGEPGELYQREGTFRGIEEGSSPLSKEEIREKKGKENTSFLGDAVEFGGIVDIQPYSRWGVDRSRVSDIGVAEVELNFAIRANECARAFLSLSHEPPKEGLFLKEAFILLGDNPKSSYFLQIGRFYLPFGVGTGALIGDTLSIIDPLTIEIFEAQEEAMLFSVRAMGLYGGIYFFNGNGWRERKSHHIDQYGTAMRYEVKGDEFVFNCGFDMISSIYDSDEIQHEYVEALKKNRYAKGLALHSRIFYKNISLLLEYNGTFSSTTFNYKDKNICLSPKAWQVEIGYQNEIFCKATYFAINFSQSFGLHSLFPRSRLLLTAGRWIYDGVLISFEYGHEAFYPEKRGNYGVDTVIGQFVLEW